MNKGPPFCSHNPPLPLLLLLLLILHFRVVSSASVSPPLPSPPPSSSLPSPSGQQGDDDNLLDDAFTTTTGDEKGAHESPPHFKERLPPGIRRCITDYDYDPCEGRIPDCKETVPAEHWLCSDTPIEWKIEEPIKTFDPNCTDRIKPVEELNCRRCDDAQCDGACYDECNCAEEGWWEHSQVELNPRTGEKESIKFCYNGHTGLCDLTVAMAQCIRHDSQLASIQSRAEYSAIVEQVRYNARPGWDAKMGRYLIGHRIFRDPETAEILSIANTDGTQTTYGWSRKWGTGFNPKEASPWERNKGLEYVEPNNNDTSGAGRWENCVAIEFKENGKYGWVDTPCDGFRHVGFICKQRLPRMRRKKKTPKFLMDEKEEEKEGEGENNNIDEDDEQQQWTAMNLGPKTEPAAPPRRGALQLANMKAADDAAPSSEKSEEEEDSEEEGKEVEEFGECDDGWTEFEKYCIKTFASPNVKTDFYSAMKVCTKFAKGTLGVLYKQEMLKKIITTQFRYDMENPGADKFYWIGMYLYRTRDKIMSVAWVDGKTPMNWNGTRIVHNAQVKWSALPWEVGQPVLTVPNAWRKKCVAIAVRNGVPRLNSLVSLDCATKANYICTKSLFN